MANQTNYNAYIKACLEAVEGKINTALNHLENALAETPDMRGWARRDPNLKSLHGNPRFEALVQAN